MATVTLTATMDAHTSGSSISQLANASSATIRTTYNGALTFPMFLAFDLSSVPSAVTAAVLKVMPTAKVGGVVGYSVYRNTSSWVESDGSSVPSVNTTAPINPAALSQTDMTVGVLLEIPISATIVEGWRTGSIANHGLAIQPTSALDPNDGFTIYAREGATPPVLEVTYSNSAPTSPNWTTAAGTYDVASSLTIAAPFTDPDPGDVASAYALRRTIGATVRWWDGTDWDAVTEQKISPAVESWTFSAGWGADGDATHAYAVKYWDALDTEGSYSGSLLIVPSVKANPVITFPVDGVDVTTSTVTATGTVSDATAYRWRVLDPSDSSELYTTGKTGTTGNSVDRLLGFTFENGSSYRVELTTWNSEDLASDADTVEFDVVYTPPATPTLTVTAVQADGRILLEVSNPAPTGSQPDITGNQVRRRITGTDWSGSYLKSQEGDDGPMVITENGAANDRAIASGVDYEYQVVAFGTDGTTSESAWTGGTSGDPGIYGGGTGGY